MFCDRCHLETFERFTSWNGEKLVKVCSICRDWLEGNVPQEKAKDLTLKWVGVLPAHQVGGRSVVRHTYGGTVEKLDPRHDLANHSPDGFHWGYGGSGPAQLSLALLTDFTKSDRLALRYYQKFKFKVIARLDQGQGWTLTRDQVAEYLAEIIQEEERKG